MWNTANYEWDENRHLRKNSGNFVKMSFLHIKRKKYNVDMLSAFIKKIKIC